MSHNYFTSIIVEGTHSLILQHRQEEAWRQQQNGQRAMVTPSDCGQQGAFEVSLMSSLLFSFDCSRWR